MKTCVVELPIRQRMKISNGSLVVEVVFPSEVTCNSMAIDVSLTSIMSALFHAMETEAVDFPNLDEDIKEMLDRWLVKVRARFEPIKDTDKQPGTEDTSDDAEPDDINDDGNDNEEETPFFDEPEPINGRSA